MSRSGGTADQAFERLRILSNQADVNVSDVAGRLISDAAARARARRTDRGPSAG